MRLRELRIRAALTMEELAQRSGVSKGTIVRLEAGHDARLPTIRKLAQALGVEPREVMGLD